MDSCGRRIFLNFEGKYGFFYDINLVSVCNFHISDSFNAYIFYK